MTSCIVGKREIKLDVIPEEGSSVATPPPGAGDKKGSGEEPVKAEPQEEQEVKEPIVAVSVSTEVRKEGEGEKMDISETAQVEQMGEPGEQV